MISQDFGIILTCYPGDIWFTRACLNSINTFAADIPIALIVDKNPCIKDLIDLYNVKYTIRREDVQNSYFRNECFGSRFTTAVALFESPFEKFLYVDSDTIFWGNICPGVVKMLEKYDFVHNEPHEPYTEYILKTQYFDYDRIFKYAPIFPWEGLHFFNGGVMAGRRGKLDPDLFIFLHKIWKKDRTLIPCDIQGVTNFTVFYSYTQGKLSVGEMHLQTIVPVYDPDDLRKGFRFSESGPVVHKNTVLHYAGLKPMNKSYKGFIEPVNYFRKKHLRESRNVKRFFGIAALVAEEYMANFNAYYSGSIVKYIKYKLTGRK